MAKKKTKAAPKPKAAKKTTKKAATKKKATRKKKATAGSRGLAPNALTGDAPDEVAALEAAVAQDGGAVLARFRDPLGGAWQLLAALPVEAVKPAPFQRDLSDTHVKKLDGIINRLDRFLDPIIVVRTEGGEYWTPNGHHRLAAMTKLGAKSITALVVPQFELAYQILALNTEKAPGLKERALEVIRLARNLAEVAPAKESAYALYFDEANLLTLGCCYEAKPRFSGSVYQSLLKRCDDFLDDDLAAALAAREARAQRLLEVDAAVTALVDALKAKGIQSSYLRNFVVARVNPLKGTKGKQGFDETVDALLANCAAFDVDAIDAGQVSG